MVVAGTTIDEQDLVVSCSGILLLLLLRSRLSASCSKAFFL